MDVMSPNKHGRRGFGQAGSVGEEVRADQDAG